MLNASNLPYELLHMIFDYLDNDLDSAALPELQLEEDYFDINDEFPQRLCCLLMLVNRHWAEAVRDHPLYTTYCDYVYEWRLASLIDWLLIRQFTGKKVYNRCRLHFPYSTEYGAFYHLYQNILGDDVLFKSLSISHPRMMDHEPLRQPSPWDWREPHLLPSKLKARHLSFDEMFRFPPEWKRTEPPPLLDHLKSLAIEGCNFNYLPIFRGGTQITKLHLKCHFFAPKSPKMKMDTFHAKTLKRYPHLKELSVELYPDADELFLDEPEEPEHPEFDETDRNDYSQLVYLPLLEELEILRSYTVRIGAMRHALPNLKTLHYCQIGPNVQFGRDDQLPNKLETLTFDFLSDKDGYDELHKLKLQRRGFDLVQPVRSDIFHEDYALFRKEKRGKFKHLKVLKIKMHTSDLFTRYFNSNRFDEVMPNLEVLSIHEIEVSEDAVYRFFATHPKLRSITANIVTPEKSAELKKRREEKINSYF